MDLRHDFINYVKHILIPRPDLPAITNKYKDVKSKYMPSSSPEPFFRKNNQEEKKIPWKKIYGS